MENFGCRFSLYPMTDNFIPVILGSLSKTDTSAVYSYTDAISTVYQGETASVLDAVSGLFVGAFTDGVHMAIEGQLSNCEEVTAAPQGTGATPNSELVKSADFMVKCKLSLFGTEGANGLYETLKARCMLDREEISYGTRYRGKVGDVFAFIVLVCETLCEKGEKFTLTFTMNCNSPTAE